MIAPTRTRRLAIGHRAATAVEFALLAPVFLSMMFAIIEGSRFLWIRQSLAEVAFSTARCASVSTDCQTSASRVAYATSRAQSYGQTLTASDVEVTANTTCNATGGMVRVVVSTKFESPAVGLLPSIPAVIRGMGCYPVLR